jgi:hypothetical protein
MHHLRCNEMSAFVAVMGGTELRSIFITPVILSCCECVSERYAEFDHIASFLEPSIIEVITIHGHFDAGNGWVARAWEPGVFRLKKRNVLGSTAPFDVRFMYMSIDHRRHTTSA